MRRPAHRAGRTAGFRRLHGAAFLAVLALACSWPVAQVGASAVPRSRTRTVAAPTAASHAAASSTRPNIVLVLTDDLDATSYLDSTRFPELQDLMVKQGVSFSNFFVDESLCCPSRASILRGQYVHNHGVLGNGAPIGGFSRFHALGNESSTVATWLHARGYRTGLFGKYLNGYPQTVAPTYVPPGWDVWNSPSGGNPYGEYRYELNENGKLVQYGAQPSDYLVDVLAKKSVDFIQQSASSKKPFFMYVAPYVPHQPATPAPRYAGAFPGVQAPRPPSFDQADVSAEPQWLQHRHPLAPVVIRYIDDLYQRRLQDILGFEDLLKGVVDALQSTGKLDNTYVIFTSDNGFHLGQHRLPPGKQTPYDEDIRVPMIVRGPGIPAASSTTGIGMNIDLAPTIAALAGARTPSFVDGRSLVPLLRAPTASRRWRTAAFVEHSANARTRTRTRRAPNTLPTTSTTEPAERVPARRGCGPREPRRRRRLQPAGHPGIAHDAATA